MSFNINVYEQNILTNTIVGIDKDAVYNSIPAQIFHTRGWDIQSPEETLLKLSGLSGDQTWQLGINPYTQSRLIVCQKNPDEVSILINQGQEQQEQQGQQQRQPQLRRYSKVPDLPPSDDEDDDANPPPAILCLDRAYKAFRKHVIYFTRTYIVSVN